MNLLVLNDNIKNSLSGNDPNKTGNNSAKAKSEKKSDKAVVIKDLQILDTKLHFGMTGRVATLTLPNVQEKNIGEKKNITLAEAIQFISEKLTMEPLQEIAKSSQQILKDAFKVIEQHSTDHQDLNKVKDILSAGFGL